MFMVLILNKVFCTIYISNMANVDLSQVEKGIKFFLTVNNSELKAGEKIVLITVIRLLDEKHVISKNEVCKNNSAKRDTTYSLLRSLEFKGYLKAVRNNQYYALSFISLTQKGLLFSSRLKNFIIKNKSN
ncbi:hypothetical protein Cycma_2362 [Cyclobacterium marinum DSM 745]|uniref:Uncharacterized protein n=2 Tax=Cyclobacterium marinum TaxID=104 RepID=G0J641_CYCMS|nr:hypothetical protein Cycma_2362 [Cyclobacterium marinum DSM 745]